MSLGILWPRDNDFWKGLAGGVDGQAVSQGSSPLSECKKIEKQVGKLPVRCTSVIVLLCALQVRDVCKMQPIALYKALKSYVL